MADRPAAVECSPEVYVPPRRIGLELVPGADAEATPGWFSDRPATLEVFQPP
jgi:hypothetical protein